MFRGELPTRGAGQRGGRGYYRGRGDGHQRGRGDGHQRGRGDGHQRGRGDGHQRGRGGGHQHRGDASQPQAWSPRELKLFVGSLSDTIARPDTDRQRLADKLAGRKGGAMFRAAVTLAQMPGEDSLKWSVLKIFSHPLFVLRSAPPNHAYQRPDEPSQSDLEALRACHRLAFTVAQDVDVMEGLLGSSEVLSSVLAVACGLRNHHPVDIIHSQLPCLAKYVASREVEFVDAIKKHQPNADVKEACIEFLTTIAAGERQRLARQAAPRTERGPVGANEPQPTQFEPTFRNAPLQPSVAELLPDGEVATASVSLAEARAITTAQPLTSLTHHLDCVFHLTRADALEPLREDLAELRHPAANNRSGPPVRVLADLAVTGFWSHPVYGFAVCLRSATVCQRYAKSKGLAYKRRFLPGNLVMLSQDRFRTAVVGVCAGKQEDLARGFVSVAFPLQAEAGLGLVQRVAAEGRGSRIQLIESPTFWESVAPALAAIQRLRPEDTPLAVCISGQRPGAPEVANGGGAPLPTMGDIKDTAFLQQLTLDPTQTKAIELIFSPCPTPIIQGPPGTGKTYVGLAALRLMLHEKWHHGGPILVVTYTNHAVDSLLEALLEHEGEYFNSNRSELIRLGSRSKSERIQQHQVQNFATRVGGLQKVLSEFEAVCKKYNYTEFTPEVADGATAAEIASINKVRTDATATFKSLKRRLEAIESSQAQPALREELRAQMESINPYKFLSLWVGDARRVAETGAAAADAAAADERDANAVDTAAAGLVVHYDQTVHPDEAVRIRREKVNVWRRNRMRRLMPEVIEAAKLVEDAARRHQQRQNDAIAAVLRKARIIAGTTTGLARYLASVEGANVQCCLVEEAAEVSEAHMLATLLPTVTRLIQIGDHQQLRPPVETMKAKAKGLDISLMERLAGLRPEAVVTLATQRRMQPAIAEYVKPLYEQALEAAGGLDTHANVRRRTCAPRDAGLANDGGWMHVIKHRFKEVADDLSKRNPQEAHLVVQIAQHVAVNWTAHKAAAGRRGEADATSATTVGEPTVTIVTPYAGQHHELRSLVTRLPDRVRATIQIATLDDFQGRENDVVLLSFTRSDRLGFLKDNHRICVAISRARNVFMIVGNFDALEANQQLRNTFWQKVLQTAEREKAIRDRVLRLECQTHGCVTEFPLNDPRTELRELSPAGGCRQLCGRRRPCGHVCELVCHAGDCVDAGSCVKPCAKSCEHGHPCAGRCCDLCPPCGKAVQRTFPLCGHVVENVRCSLKACPKKIKLPHPVCSHVIELRCSEKENIGAKPCTAKCGHKRTTCEHKCTAVCGECHVRSEVAGQPVHRKPCSHPCNKVLVCGHPCTEPCSRVCPPCTKGCPFRCAHVTKCRHPCGEPCVPCQEPCSVRCPHRECRAVCSKPCTVGPCEEACPRVSPGCKATPKHPCRGKCGEPCPPRCLTCEPLTEGEDTFCTVDPDDTSAPFTVLPACKHMFRTEDFDRHVEAQLAPARGIHPVRCPACQEIVPADECPRHKRVLLERQAAIERVKANARDQARQVAEAVETAQGNLVKTIGALNRTPVANSCELLVTLRAAVESTLKELKNTPGGSLQARELLAARANAWGILCTVTTARNVCFRSDVASQRSGFLQRAAEIVSTIRTCYDTNETQKLRLACLRALGDACIVRGANDMPEADLVDAILSSGSLSDEERRSIHTALVNAGQIRSQGAWFECPNGHLYAIGECGGAVVESRCPTCGATIGGTGHRTNSGNRHTGFMDGSTRTAWPGGA